MPLALAYTFVSRPSPIQASAPGATNTITLDVSIENPQVGSPALKDLSIQIPVGGGVDDAASLSARTPLPKPAGLIADTGWTYEIDGSTIILTPPLSITETLRFSFPQIEVNDASATVPITISEEPTDPKQPVVTDATSYSLSRVPHGCPITSFWAVPPVLETVDLPLALKWTGDTDAAKYAYRVRTDDWSAPANGAYYYSYADGSSATGVPGPKLIFDTELALDIYEKQGGKMVVIGTATVAVTIDQPQFSDLVSLARVDGLGGLVACMNWEARGTRRCALENNDRPLTDAAPPDTSDLNVGTPYQGYLATIGDGQASLVASAAASSGSLYVRQPLGGLPALPTPTTIAVPVAGSPVSMQYGANETACLVTQDDGSYSLCFMRLEADEAWGVVDDMSFDPALSRDGYWAMYSADIWDRIGYYHVTNRASSGPLTSDPLEQFSMILGAGFNADGTEVYVAGYIEFTPGIIVMAANLDDWKFEQIAANTGGMIPGKFVTVCGGLVAQSAYWPGPVMLVAPAAAGQPLQAVQYQAQSIAVTPDGTVAVMAMGGGADLRVIDAATGVERPPVPLSVVPTGVAVTSDGRFAAVASQSANKVVFVDIEAAEELSGALAAAGPVSVGISADGSLAVFESSPPQVRVWPSSAKR